MKFLALAAFLLPFTGVIAQEDDGGDTLPDITKLRVVTITGCEALINNKVPLPGSDAPPPNVYRLYLHNLKSHEDITAITEKAHQYLALAAHDFGTRAVGVRGNDKTETPGDDYSIEGWFEQIKGMTRAEMANYHLPAFYQGLVMSLAASGFAVDLTLSMVDKAKCNLLVPKGNVQSQIEQNLKK